MLLASACSGTSLSPLGTQEDSGTLGVDGGHQGTAPDGGRTTTSHDASGPTVFVRITAVQTPLGAGGGAEETPTDQRLGLLGLSLMTSKTDPSPVVVFDNTTPVDTPYNAGSSTVIGSAPASSLKAGTYSWVRVPVAYTKFTVAGTYHLGATPVPGQFTDTISLSPGTMLEGAVRDRGWWSSSFAYDGMTEGEVSAENAQIAQPGDTSDINLDLSQPIAAYVFPVQIVIPDSITEDMEILFTVNTWEDFHWTDESEPGYATDVFDVSDGAFEPVTQLGANSFTVTLVPVTGS
jgi:hypothetical protein